MPSTFTTNRYGSLVFNSNVYSKGWDGTFNGQALPAGTYYIINLKNGKNKLAGPLTIIR